MNTIKTALFATLSIAVAICIAVVADSPCNDGNVSDDDSSDNSVGNNGNVATMNGKEYATLKAAFDDIGENTSVRITLISNCEASKVITVNLGKEVVLDLNGYIISNNLRGDRLFDVKATSFTVIGTQAGSGMAIPTDNTDSYGFLKISADSTVTLDGGTYTGRTYGGAFVKVLSSAPNSVVTIRDAVMTTDSWILDTQYLQPSEQTNTLTVIGGKYTTETESFCIWANPETARASFDDVTIISNTGPGVFAAGPTTVFNNCKITVNELYKYGWYSSAIAVSGAEAIVNSGSYTSTKGYGACIYSSGGALTINGGEFSGEIAAISAAVDRETYGEADAVISFYDGTTVGNWSIGDEYVFVTVSGGTHSTDVSGYCAPGYRATLSSSGLYEVNVNLSLSFSVENNRRGETTIQPVLSTEATIDATKTKVEWTFEGQHYSDNMKIAPTQAGLYTATVTVYDENGTSGTATATYQFDNTHTVTLEYDGTKKTLTVPHNSTISNLPTPGKSHYSYIWTDADGSEFKSTDKVIRDLELTATLVMSDIDVKITYVREDGRVYIQATCTPAVAVEDMECTWAIDGGEPSAADRVELTNESKHYRFEMSAKTSDGTLARAVWEDDLCKTTGSSTETIKTDSEKVSIVPSDISDTAIDQTIDFNMPDIAEDEKVTISIKGNISDTGSTVDVSVQDITQNGQTWTDGMSAAVDVSVSNVRNGYSLEITVKVQIPDNYLGAVAYYYNEARGSLEKVDSTIDEATGWVTIYTDHNTPYVVQVLTTDHPDPVVPDTPDVPSYDDDDDPYIPYAPTTTGSGSNDQAVKTVACAAAAAVACMMAALLIMDTRKSR